MSKPVKTLIIGLENPWPEKTPVGSFIDGIEYTQLGQNIYIYGHIIPGFYKTSLSYDLYLIKHIKITGNLSKKDIIIKYPILTKWIETQWPFTIGRYKLSLQNNEIIISSIDIKYIVDFVFGDISSENWKPEYKKEIIDGSYGYWSGWSYDLKSCSLAELTMYLIMKIPEKDRIPYKIVRYLTAFSNEKNSPEGLLHGMWDQTVLKSKIGKEPGFWKSTSHILNERCSNNVPIKFAQCWVFSEVLTSMFRYLRIPARTIYAKNARIDRGCDGGIDLDLIVSKGQDSSVKEVIIDIWSMMEETVNKGDTVDIEKVISEEDDLLHITVNKGCNESAPKPIIPIVNIEGDISFTAMDYVKLDDSSWNFHVWNETFIERPDLKNPYNGASWNCSDASPSVTTSHPHSFKNGYVLGPCPVSSIKDGNDHEYDFSYLCSAVNGVYRFWKSTRIDSADGNTYNITYPTLIAYNSLTREGVIQRKVEIYTRDTTKSCGIIHVVRDEITDSYLHDASTAYKIHHKNHPILVSWKPGTEPTFEIQNPSINNVYIQICYLKIKELISYHRTSINNWNTFIIPKPPPEATRLSIFIAFKGEKKWWAQVI